MVHFQDHHHSVIAVHALLVYLVLYLYHNAIAHYQEVVDLELPQVVLVLSPELPKVLSYNQDKWSPQFQTLDLLLLVKVNHVAVPIHKNHHAQKLKRTENFVSLVTFVLLNQSSGKHSRMLPRNQKELVQRAIIVIQSIKVVDQVAHQTNALLFASPTKLLQLLDMPE